MRIPLAALRRALAQRVGQAIERQPTGAWGAGMGGAIGASSGAAESERQGGDTRQMLASALLGGFNGATMGYLGGRFLPRGIGLLGAASIAPGQGKAVGSAISGGPALGIGMGDNPGNVARRALRRASQENDMSEENIRRLIQEEGGDEEALRYAMEMM